MKKSTRDLIIETASGLIEKYGFNHTGINEILKQANVPKGSFYYYFESKEALGHAVIEKAAQDRYAVIEEALASVPGSPLERMRRVFEMQIEQYDVEAVHSCILTKLGQEMAEQHEGFREKLEQVFKRIVQCYADVFEQAKEAGELPDGTDSMKLAEFLFAVSEGSVMLAKLKKSKEPLKNFLEQFNRLTEGK
ncbi:MAG: TetR family transcriptional regulator [Firmicutes bacterium]|nr:TetR family transcriptional regulator [Bacillota bacterium]